MNDYQIYLCNLIQLVIIRYAIAYKSKMTQQTYVNKKSQLQANTMIIDSRIVNVVISLYIPIMNINVTQSSKVAHMPGKYT